MAKEEEPRSLGEASRDKIWLKMLNSSSEFDTSTMNSFSSSFPSFYSFTKVG